jgi:hypothetical protein
LTIIARRKCAPIRMRRAPTGSTMMPDFNRLRVINAPPSSNPTLTATVISITSANFPVLACNGV